MGKPLINMLILMLAFTAVRAQTITYSSPDEEDIRTNNFEIIGKLNGKVIVYKNSHNYGFFNLYNADMHIDSKRQVPNLPTDLAAVNFVAYPDGFLMFYQYQKRNTLYIKLLKFNQNAEPVGNVTDLDTCECDWNAKDNKTYKILVSENKQQIMAFKITKLDNKDYRYKSILLNKDCVVQHKSTGNINITAKNEFFSEFLLDNDGNLSALWETGTVQNDNISSVTIMEKRANEDTLSLCPVDMSKMYLDDVKLKVDNVNHHYLVTSFYSKQKRGNVDGLFFYLCDTRTLKTIFSNTTVFSTELRNDARGENGVKDAFNDYYLKNIVFNQTGGFLILSESEYTSSRSNGIYNRWDNMNNSMYLNNYPYSYNPLYAPYPGSNNMISRYFSDNIVLFSFDDKGSIIWSNTIRKVQYDDINEKSISYGLVNTGEELHFLYNLHERGSVLLTHASVTTDGKLLYNNSPMKSLDQGYDFLPRLAKQVGRKQIIVPCLYGNVTCFAKIEF